MKKNLFISVGIGYLAINLSLISLYFINNIIILKIYGYIFLNKKFNLL